GRWTGLMLWLQKVAGEPWLWSIRPEELGQFMAELGWAATSAQGDLKYKYGVEYFAVAKKKRAPIVFTNTNDSQDRFIME
ncbi:MAG: hypothetical protein KAI29_22700, partial [Cyclobacteriaceae bacterium]|nr:hypothetical protein [Cyclobacteriaceae bacterium]